MNGFEGASEYDHNGYLTAMMINAHQIDPIFQRDCKNLFDFRKFRIKCKYSAAPVKTKERSIVKAELDYKTSIKHDWPYTKHIFDMIRCSVVFTSVKDLE